eukprot:Nitzschia sp. Nitz4//scaffold269_size25945//5720//7108//NITZ4_008286-RA/size25945-processed-gene-0.1-mRNA-1//1//CDS//3329544958//6323//frame0
MEGSVPRRERELLAVEDLTTWPSPSKYSKYEVDLTALGMRSVREELENLGLINAMVYRKDVDTLLIDILQFWKPPVHQLIEAILTTADDRAWQMHFLFPSDYPPQGPALSEPDMQQALATIQSVPYIRFSGVIWVDKYHTVVLQSLPSPMPQLHCIDLDDSLANPEDFQGLMTRHPLGIQGKIRGVRLFLTEPLGEPIIPLGCAPHVDGLTIALIDSDQEEMSDLMDDITSLPHLRYLHFSLPCGISRPEYDEPVAKFSDWVSGEDCQLIRLSIAGATDEVDDVLRMLRQITKNHSIKELMLQCGDEELDITPLLQCLSRMHVDKINLHNNTLKESSFQQLLDWQLSLRPRYIDLDVFALYSDTPLAVDIHNISSIHRKLNQFLQEAGHLSNECMSDLLQNVSDEYPAKNHQVSGVIVDVVYQMMKHLLRGYPQNFETSARNPTVQPASSRRFYGAFDLEEP